VSTGSALLVGALVVLVCAAVVVGVVRRRGHRGRDEDIGDRRRGSREPRIPRQQRARREPRDPPPDGPPPQPGPPPQEQLPP
jgi:hypothetical protein